MVKGECKLKEAAITQSPHVYDPLRVLSAEEREARYRTRIDSSFKPYSVFDILQKVYHRSFEDDLLSVLGEAPERFTTSAQDWNVSRVWVNRLKVIRSESVFFQPKEDFQVDILADAKIRFEEVKKGSGILTNRYDNSLRLRLRYSFDLRPCHMNCRFVDVILDDSESLIEKNKTNIPVDKYLLPVRQAGAGNDDLQCGYLPLYAHVHRSAHRARLPQPHRRADRKRFVGAAGGEDHAGYARKQQEYYLC